MKHFVDDVCGGGRSRGTLGHIFHTWRLVCTHRQTLRQRHTDTLVADGDREQNLLR